MEAATQRYSWKVKKKLKKTCEKVHVHVFFSKILGKLKVISSYIYGKKYFQGTTHFFWIKIEAFWNRKSKVFGQAKPCFISDWK